MDNKEKYELIVKIKELLINTEVHTNKDIKDTDRISLNASKVMSLIYSNLTLTDFFNKQVKTHQKLRADKRYKDFRFIKDIYYQRLSKISGLKYDTTKYDTPYYQDFILYLDAHKFKEITETENFIKLCNYFEAGGIFEFLKNIFYSEGYTNGFNEIDKYKDDFFNLFDIGTYANDDNERNYFRHVIQTYDFYYLKESEINTDFYFMGRFEFLGMLIAYRKVLSILLEYLYTLNMTDAEKQEYKEREEKQETLKNGLKTLMYGKQETYKVLEEILHNPTIDRNKLSNNLKKDISTIDKQIYTISECLMGKRHGIKTLNPFIAKNEFIINKLIDNLNNKKNL